MKKIISLSVVLGLILCLGVCTQKGEQEPEKENVAVAQDASERKVKDSRPNILLVVVDDMGFSDVGAFGSEIRTPNIDAIAEAGIRVTNFCVGPTCAPTRGSGPSRPQRQHSPDRLGYAIRDRPRFRAGGPAHRHGKPRLPHLRESEAAHHCAGTEGGSHRDHPQAL